MDSPRRPGRPRTRKGDDFIKTTVELPYSLWRRVKTRALDERSDLRAVVIAALEAHLKTPTKR